ncbi:hypothetical protein [Phaeovulum sp. NW3]|uniref:hypothetical protein n=1 Tax=Phaeovulum sp. NW3 TaxID=2934933 RepID=UPI00202098DD|nr:hypothetical protein [Phaeovulum sp. NW3]MCL7464868.1 hypothetical protein [Phaeovulum sp. NW3]
MDPASFADLLQRSANTHHGVVGPEFVQKLIGTFEKSGDQISALIEKRAKTWLGCLAFIPDGQTQRVAKRFAVIGVAGEIATVFGLTGWNKGDALSAAKDGFHDWYDRRYGGLHEELAASVAALKQFMDTHLTGLPMVAGPHGGGEPKGWRDTKFLYLTPKTWVEIFHGADSSKVAHALREAQMLRPEGNRPLRKAPRAIPGRPRLSTLDIERVQAFKAG